MATADIVYHSSESIMMGLREEHFTLCYDTTGELNWTHLRDTKHFGQERNKIILEITVFCQPPCFYFLPHIFCAYSHALPGFSLSVDNLLSLPAFQQSPSLAAPAPPSLPESSFVLSPFSPCFPDDQVTCLT